MSLDDLRIVSITFNIMSMLICFLLAGLYYPKKRISTKENSIYDVMLLFNIFALIFELIFYLIAYNNVPDVIVVWFERLFYCANSIWIFLHTLYILVVAKDGKESKISFEKKKVLSIAGIVAIVLIFIFAPLGHVYENGKLMQSTGFASVFVFLWAIVLTIVNVILVIIYRKNIKKSKLVPLIIFVLVILAEMGASVFGVRLLLITLPMTFVSFMMYHTIENPDVQMIEQLNIARDQAEKANSAKTDFLSNMSHEIRTPLNAIVGFSNLLLDDETVPDNAKDEVRDIVMASDNLLEIVNGILDISKIEANKLEIIDNEYDIHKVLNELVALTKGRLGDKPIEFKTNFDASIPDVLYGDAQRLKQICVNLLTNAVKYTKEGWIEFKISSVIKGDVCRLIISVEDTGIGIKEANINKLFNRFERLDMEENMTIEGTGLGLAITKKLVDLMHGTIVVQSVFGKGSKFTVSLDQFIVKNPTIKIETEKEPQEKVKVENKKILLVDDNKINLKVAEKLLEAYGVETDSVESGFDCLDKLNNGNHYDLVLLDDMMPKMSGVETLQKIKEEFSDFKTPVVVLTANALTGMKEKYLNDGFDDYLAKPINKEELNRVINEYLNKE